MNLSEIETSVHEAIDAGDADALDYYAEHVAESMNPLTEALCLAIIGTDYSAWASVMAVAAQKAPALADALESIERHIDNDKQLEAFIERRARRLSDEAEHNAQLLAELNAELNRGTCSE